jgi:hypothetical protein
MKTQSKNNFFYAKTPEEKLRNISTFHIRSYHVYYEGMRSITRSLVGKSRVAAFMGVKNRIWERINGWKEKFFSQAGKEVLLKAVIQSIPTYTMSVFQLPKTLCKDINSMMAKFWWGHKGSDARIAWMSWERMGRAKVKGGMGYRDLENFNMALLAK